MHDLLLKKTIEYCRKRKQQMLENCDQTDIAQPHPNNLEDALLCLADAIDNLKKLTP